MKILRIDKSNLETGENKMIIQQSLDLINRVFMEFEAPEYSDEGINEFKSFIRSDNILVMILEGRMIFWCRLDAEHVIGVIASRLPCHISLLFVDPEHHRKGIAKSLYHEFIAYYKANSSYHEVTVNSSPYAVEVYRKLGFSATDSEQITNGIRYLPMKHDFMVK